jgi:hypothetical protein
MIWFVCKQCGKRHGRADHLSNTLVFCECGHGNRVPWSSTVAEPPPEEARPAPPRPRPSLPPLDDEGRGASYPPSRRSRDARRPNPAYCLNHDESAKEMTCDACRASFCSACVVTLQGRTLCGPCKNFRIRGLNRPARVASLAVVAFVLALVSTVVCLFLTFLAIGLQTTMNSGVVGAVVVCAIALIMAGGELVIGWLALRQIDGKANLGGRGLAITGLTAGAVGVLWSVSIATFSIAKQWQG